jgi:hypothetical protein
VVSAIKTNTKTELADSRVKRHGETAFLLSTVQRLSLNRLKPAYRRPITLEEKLFKVAQWTFLAWLFLSRNGLFFRQS